MSTSTIALDSVSTYSFLGYGTHTPLYEKGFPQANDASALVTAGPSYTQFDALIAQLTIFPWMRRTCLGGECYREGYDGPTSYPSLTQALLQARMNSLGTWRYILSPYCAPSALLTDGLNRTFNTPTASSDLVNLMGFGGNWQGFTDALDRQIKIALGLGCHVELLGLLSECGNTTPSANFWNTSLTSAQFLAMIRQVWLGQSPITGGGIASRYPQLKLIADDPVGTFTAAASLAGASDALAAVTYYGRHTYADGIAAGTAGYAQVEFGAAIADPIASTTSADVRGVAHIAHDDIVYYQAPIACYWTSLRDVTAKSSIYTAKPLFNLNTAAHTYAATPYYWTLKPFVLASGKAPSTGYFSTAAYGTSANYDPVANVFVTAFQRGDDAKYCVVYANFSGSARTDTIAFTVGGNPHDLSGTSKTYPVLSMSSDPTPSNISTTAGSYALGSVADATLVLLELS